MIIEFFGNIYNTNHFVTMIEESKEIYKEDEGDEEILSRKIESINDSKKEGLLYEYKFRLVTIKTDYTHTRKMTEKQYKAECAKLLDSKE